MSDYQNFPAPITEPLISVEVAVGMIICMLVAAFGILIVSTVIHELKARGAMRKKSWRDWKR